MLESMNVMNIYRLVGIGLLAINAACTPKPPACANHFAGGEPPSITNQSLAAKTEMLCFEGYATMHSGISRTPVWSAEHLTADRVDTAKGLKRKNTFHAEQQLPASE